MIYRSGFLTFDCYLDEKAKKLQLGHVSVDVSIVHGVVLKKVNKKLKLSAVSL